MGISPTKIKFTENLKKCEEIYNTVDKHLLGLGVIALFNAICITSLSVNDGRERCCNSLFVGGKGIGKKELIERLFSHKGNKHVIIPFSKATGAGIAADLPDDYVDHKSWAVEDLISTVSTLGHQSLNDFCTFHNEFLEKGRYKKATRTSGFVDKTGKIQCCYAMALGEFKKVAKKWRNLTFMDRFIPFYYSYEDEEDKTIGLKILDEDIIIPKIKLPYFKKGKKVSWDRSLSTDCLKLANQLKKGRDSAYIARSSIDIKKLISSCALLNGRDKVCFDDYMIIKSFVPYMINPACFSSVCFKILNFIRENKETTSKEIVDYMQEFGYKEKTILYNLEQLRKKKQLEVEKKSRDVGGYYYIYK
jgi:hypothetical protein